MKVRARVRAHPPVKEDGRSWLHSWRRSKRGQPSRLTSCRPHVRRASGALAGAGAVCLHTRASGVGNSQAFKAIQLCN